MNSMSRTPITQSNRKIPLILVVSHQCEIKDGKETHSVKVNNSSLIGEGETIAKAENSLARKLSDKLNGF